MAYLTFRTVLYNLPTVYFDGDTADQGEHLRHTLANNTRLKIQANLIRNHGRLCVDFPYCRYCRLCNLPTNGFHLGQDYRRRKM